MLQRTLAKTIEEISKTFPALLVTGPRQVGKTTLLEMLASKKRRYVSLDDFTDRELANKEPELFLQKYKPPIIIDEVQYAPKLFTYIKIYIDEHKNSNGLFWLTGSQKFELMQDIQETLAGRIAIIDLLGFSYKELNNSANKSTPFLASDNWIKNNIKNIYNKDITDLYKTIWNGFFPRLINAQNKNRDIFYRSYVQTYIERDVKDYYSISNDITFYNFLKAVAARTGQLLNYQDIARDLEIDGKTVKKWLAILEKSGIIKLLYPYYNNITKRIIKTPKLYFLDTGLCSHLTGWNSPEALEAGAMDGAILETYVFTEILKSYWHNGKTPEIYFYRDDDQKEIDFILEQNNTLYPIEVKKTTLPQNITKQFNILNNLKKNIGTKCILCLTKEIKPITKDIFAIPIWSI